MLAGRTLDIPFAVGEDAHAGRSSETITSVVSWFWVIARLLNHAIMRTDVPTLNSLVVKMPREVKRFHSPRNLTSLTMASVSNLQ